MKNVAGIGQVYGFLKLFQDVLAVVMPALEMLMKRDLNGNGEVGK